MVKALVTGGSQRIGKAIAIYLAERGYDVAIHYNKSRTEANSVVKTIQQLGRKAVAIQADLLDPKQAQQLVTKASQELDGTINCLVNNASIFEYDTLSSNRNSNRNCESDSNSYNVIVMEKTSQENNNCNSYSDSNSYSNNSLNSTEDNNLLSNYYLHMNSNLLAPLLLTQSMAQQELPPLIDKNGEPIATGLVINMVDMKVKKLNPQFFTYTLSKVSKHLQLQL